MPIVHDGNGVPWLEPQHLDGSLISHQLASGAAADAVKKAHKISDSEWGAFLSSLSIFYRSQASPTDKDAARVKHINDMVSQWALALPLALTVAELDKIEALVNSPPKSAKAIQGAILSMAVLPDFRAVQLHGRMLQLPVFKEFAYIVDSAAFAYYRMNVVGCLFALVPVIEGILLRWQGWSVASTVRKPSFKDSIRFLQDSPRRQPFPTLPHFYDATLTSVVGILQRHFFKDSSAGPSHDHFNRHLILHLLDDQAFCTPTNAQRAFLLIDLLSDLYVSENRLSDPRFYTDEEKRQMHKAAYIDAAFSGLIADCPELILPRTHPKLKLV